MPLTVKIDMKQFLVDHFKTPDGLIYTFNAYAVEAPPRDTVRKWFERSSLSTEWLAKALAVAELEQGSPVSLVGYIK